MSGTPTREQYAFRFRTDAGAVEGTPTWKDAENTNVSHPTATPIRLRVLVRNTGNANTGNQTWELRCAKNGGSYVAVTTSSSNVQSADASSDADDATLSTQRLTSPPSGTWSNGFYDESGAASNNILSGRFTEYEFGITIVNADVSPGDTLDFRVYADGAALQTYTTTGRITVASGTQTLTPALFDDSTTDSFPAATVTPGGVTLTAALFTEAADSFYAPTVSFDQTLTQSSTFTDADTFHAPTVTQPTLGEPVQQKTNSGASVSSLGVTFDSLPASGNGVAVLISSWFDGNTGISSVTDNQTGNTYTQRASIIDVFDSTCTAIYVCESIGSPSGSFTVTVTPNNTPNDALVVTIVELPDLATSAFDVAKTRGDLAATNDQTTGNSATTAQADEIVLAACTIRNGVSNVSLEAATTGYTELGVQNDGSTYVGHEASYKIVSATGVQVASWDHDNTNGEATSALITLKLDTGSSSQNLTASLFNDAATDAFPAATVTPGAVTLTPSLYDDSTDTFPAATVAATYALTASLLDDSTDTFYAATVTPGTVTLTASLVDDSTDTFPAATVTPGAVGLTASLLDDSVDTFHAATITNVTTLSPSLLDDSIDAFPAATVAATYALTPSLLDDSVDAFPAATASASYAIAAPLVDDSADAFPSAALAASYALVAPLLDDSADAFPAPTVAPGAVDLTPALVDDGTDAFYAATVSQGGAPQELTPALFDDSADTFPAATVTPGVVALAPALLDDSADAFGAASVAAGAVNLDPPLVDDGTDAFYAHVLSQGGAGQELTPGLVVDADSFYAALVAPGVVEITPSLVVDADTVYAPTATSSYALAAPFVDEGDVIYAATLAPGAVNLDPPLLSDADTIYAPLVSQGAITLEPPLVDEGDTLHAPSVSASYTLSVPLLSDADGFGAHAVTPGAIDLQPPLVDGGGAIYAPTLLQFAADPFLGRIGYALSPGSRAGAASAASRVAAARSPGSRVGVARDASRSAAA